MSSKLKFTKILLFIGLVIGLVKSFNYGITYPTEVLGYSLPYVISLAALGLIFDLMNVLFGKLKQKVKQCNFCKEEILVDAIKCKHCGSTLD